VSSKTDDAGVKYLLSLQVLLDLCGTLNNPASAWAKSVTTSRLRLSVLTVVLARSIVNGAGPAQDGVRLRARLFDLLAKLKSDGGEPLPFGEGAAIAWQSFMNEPSMVSMLQIDRQFYAVAFSEGLCAIEYDHPLSAALGPLGVKVHSLSPRP
jgi:hypothetical protein